MTVSLRNNLDFIEDLLEEFHSRRKFFADNNNRSNFKQRSKETTKLADIVDWLEGDPIQLPAWKEHLIKLYVKNTVLTVFTGGNKREIANDKPVMNKKDTRPTSSNIPQTRIIRGKVKKMEPVVEMKKNIVNQFRDKKVTNVNKKSSSAVQAPPPKVVKKKEFLEQKRESPTKLPIKKRLEETSKVDNLWKDIFSRSNINRTEIREVNHQTRPISPLIAPDVSITPRKQPQILDSFPIPTPVSPFNIDKFLAKIKDTESRRQPISPVPSEASSSTLTYPIRATTTSYMCFVDSEEEEREKRLQEIKKSLLDVESPTSSSDSTICRVLNNCFDTYYNSETPPFVYDDGKDFAYSCSNYSDESWGRPPSTPLAYSGNDQLVSHRDVEPKGMNCNTEEEYYGRAHDKDLSVSAWSPSSPISSSSLGTKTGKDLQRSLLEADPKFKRVIDDIRRESEEVLKRNSPRQVHPANYSAARKLEFEAPPRTLSYKPTCCSSLSTEMCLGSDFTDANSDILIYPSSSNCDSL